MAELPSPKLRTPGRRLPVRGRARAALGGARGGTRRRASGSPPTFATTFAALGDQTRLRLIERLGGCVSGRRGGDGAMSITKLTAEFKVSRQAITKHLRVMQSAGLVRNTRRGRESVWRLEWQRLAEARHYLGLISKQWDDALGRLRNFVED
jgi:DNA-binding transcriptional ArsR family regulator